eukprot:365962-Chlamydomonas_euryale.AAC.1
MPAHVKRRGAGGVGGRHRVDKPSLMIVREAKGALRVPCLFSHTPFTHTPPHAPHRHTSLSSLRVASSDFCRLLARSSTALRAASSLRSCSATSSSSPARAYVRGRRRLCALCVEKGAGPEGAWSSGVGTAGGRGELE